MMICCDKVHTLSYCPEEAGFPKFTEYDKAYVSESDDETLPDFSQLVPEKITRKTNASAEEFELYLTSEVYGDDYAKAQLVFENSDSMEQFRDNIVYIQYFINYCVQMYNHLILQEKNYNLSLMIHNRKTESKNMQIENENTDKVEKIKKKIENMINTISTNVV